MNSLYAEHKNIRSFLSAISLTESQINELIREYPNIVELCIEDRINEIDLSKLYGIGSYIIKVIQRKIKNSCPLIDVISAFGGLLDYRTASLLYSKYGCINEILKKMSENPYSCLCSLNGISFKTADTILINMSRRYEANKNNMIYKINPNLEKSYDRCLQAVLFILSENELDGNTCIKTSSLKTKVSNLVPECRHFLKEILDALKHPECIYIDKKSDAVSRTITYNAENNIAVHVMNALKIKRNTWDIDIFQYRKLDSLSLTSEQVKTLDMVCKNSVSILNGSAGTGKSSSILGLINLLKDNKKSFFVSAPTGRAAKVISNYIKHPASTIHKLLQFNPLTDKFKYDKNNKLNCDIVIVDEISMCDIFLFNSLLNAIDFNKTKLLLIGDSAQLPSIGAGNILYDLISSGCVPLNSLSTVFRMDNGGMLTAATKARSSTPFLKTTHSTQIIGNDESYIFIPSSENDTLQKLKVVYIKLLGCGYSPKDILILSAYNKGSLGTNIINNLIQPIANRNCEPGNKYITLNFKGNKTKFHEGDLVIQTRNNYKAKKAYTHLQDRQDTVFIPNGEIGTIKSIEGDVVVIQFDENAVTYSRSELNQINLAYSISIHKSQGGCAKVVLLVTPKSHTFMLNSNLLYVAITRAYQRVFHFGDPLTINRAVMKKMDFRRQTSLQNILLSINQDI